MSDSYRFAPILEEIEFLIAENKQLVNIGPHLRIHERFHDIGLVCLVRRSREFPLRLSPTSRVLVDYLARNRHRLQTAREIEAGIKSNEIYAKFGTYSKGSTRIGPVHRTTVKVYIPRIREAFGRALREAKLKDNPKDILLTERSETNQVLYRLRCTVEWVTDEGSRES